MVGWKEKIDGWMSRKTEGWSNGYKKQMDGWVGEKIWMVGWIIKN